MSEHLLVLPDRDAAEALAEELLGRYAQVRLVREALAGEDDSEDHEWAVYVVAEDDSAAVADELTALAEAYDGWYDPTP